MGMNRGVFPSDDAALEGFTEAVANPADYIDRDGYDPEFLGEGTAFPMPVIPYAWAEDIAPVNCPKRPGETVVDLLYTHFSVVMSKSRRMPYYSCVNIDGKLEKRIDRTNTSWRRDPRVGLEYQLLSDGIYGRSGDGLFSRGHMTRREDPNWGTLKIASSADADTFHVTNACPQFQSFNAPIWLALEDYVKKHTWRDDMRVTVFTGPVFDDDQDAVYKPPGFPEVRVPISFWKVLIFKHDLTGEVAATAYKASQAKQLPNKNRLEFVFGEFLDYQMRIADLEQDTGLQFPGLAEIDVLGGLSPGFQLQHARVEDLIMRR